MDTFYSDKIEQKEYPKFILTAMIMMKLSKMPNAINGIPLKINTENRELTTILIFTKKYVIYNSVVYT